MRIKQQEGQQPGSRWGSHNLSNRQPVHLIRPRHLLARRHRQPPTAADEEHQLRAARKAGGQASKLASWQEVA
jgi:hypothetical protein